MIAALLLQFARVPHVHKRQLGIVADEKPLAVDSRGALHYATISRIVRTGMWQNKTCPLAP